MNILLVLSQADKTGPFLVAGDLATELLDLGHEIEIVYLHGSVRHTFPVAPRRIGYATPPERGAFDIVHSHGFRADLYVHLHRRALARDPRVRTVTTVHQYNREQIPFDYGSRWKVRLVEFLWKRALGTKDVVAGLTAHMARHYDDYLGRTDCTHVHNGRNPVLSGASNSLLEVLIERRRTGKVIGGAGHLVRRKGFDQLVALLPDNPDWTVALLGEGPEHEALLAQARGLGVADRLLLCGFQAHPCDFFQQMDVFALTSRAEGFSLVLAEAAGVGTPCVSASLPFLRELYQESELPSYEVEDVEGLSAAIRKVLADREGFAQRLRSTYLERFTRRAMALRYLELYGQVRDPRIPGTPSRTGSPRSFP